jgi:hypothetical protein
MRRLAAIRQALDAGYQPWEMARRAEVLRGWIIRDVSPPRYSGTGVFGDKDDRLIPDMPLDEWEAGVEAFLQEWQARHGADGG